MSIDPQMQAAGRAAIQRARRALGTARSWSHLIPAEAEPLEARAAELERLADLQRPVQPVTTDLPVGDLEAVLRDYAREVLELDGLREAAVAGLLPVARELHALVESSGPSWINAFTDPFAAELDAFRARLPMAPPEVRGFESDEALDALRAVTRAASNLDQILAARVGLGLIVREEGAGVGSGLWNVVDAPSLSRDPAEFNRQWPELVAQVRGFDQDNRSLSALDRWKYLTNLGFDIGLARYGQIAARLEKYGLTQTAANELNVGTASQFADVMQRADSTYRPIGVFAS